MKLPNREYANIAPAKLTAYLLNPEHIEGGSKARYLISKGVDISDVAFIEAELLRMAHENDVLEVRETKYGTKYSIVGSLGKSQIVLLATWQIDLGDDIPKFVTAVPFRTFRKLTLMKPNDNDDETL